MNWHHKPLLQLITGKKGTGKTQLWLAEIKAAQPEFLFVFDPYGEFAIKTNSPVARCANGLKQALIGKRVVFLPDKMFLGRYDEAFDFFCHFTLECCKQLHGKKVFACDELQLWCEYGNAKLPVHFQQIVDVGRREEIDMLLASQRPNEVHGKIRSQITEIITLQHTDKLPLTWLEYHGFERDKVCVLKTPGEFIRKSI